MDRVDEAARSALHLKNEIDSKSCYAVISTNGIFGKEYPLEYSLPLFMMQIMIILGTTHFFAFIFKPLRQPRVFAELIAGVVLGPSVLGQSTYFSRTLFPEWNKMVFEMLSNVGLLFFLFLVGLEMDIGEIKQTSRKAISIAAAGMIPPLLIGTIATFLFRNFASGEDIKQFSFAIFMGVAVSTTSFPALARILAERKLLNTELGRLSISAAILNDMCALVLLILGIAIAEDTNKGISSLLTILASFGFTLFLIYAVRPGIQWMIRRTSNGESANDFCICLILTGVMVCGFITEAIGSHSIFGAFAFGLIIPNGPLSTMLIERLDDFVTTLLLPLYFAKTGLRTDIAQLNYTYVRLYICTLILASAGKDISTLLITRFYNMPFSEGCTLAILMHAKGLIGVIVINVGWEQKVLTVGAYTVMVLVSVVSTGMVAPGVMLIYKPQRRLVSYRKTIQNSKHDVKLRILTCIHTLRNVPTIVNLLKISNPTKTSPITVYALQLVELTGRASAMLIVHHKTAPATNRTQAQSQNIINVFEKFEIDVEEVSVKPLTAISSYSTMHEDICNLAEDKRIAFIILPFHKQSTVDGDMEATNPILRTLNINVLDNAPCSVGILVDRGIGSPDQTSSHHIAMLFFGGPDDREALSYAWRMAEDRKIKLTVLRYLQEVQLTTMEYDSNSICEAGDEKTLTDSEKEKELDDEYITDFKLTMLRKVEKVVYKEKVVSNTVETVASVRSMDNTYDLFIVGRGRGIENPLTAGITDWSDCPELGGIGDLLASSDSLATVSVLVVQQYLGSEIDEGDGEGMPDSQEQQSDQHENFQRDGYGSSIRSIQPLNRSGN
ncbi:hypothetical protein GIB67_013357 [Kingdonia uniflora]|uniref:Cation/H+ exchanger domain-containing protein n=1 Tax=Kingdonia uniflora TaxID=39325 RepID=A0A7J7LQS6_9MAGN|nr:hypothetical protein GIB67_013357 [Kingdonia uniflora]